MIRYINEEHFEKYLLERYQPILDRVDKEVETFLTETTPTMKLMQGLTLALGWINEYLREFDDEMIHLDVERGFVDIPKHPHPEFWLRTKVRQRESP